MEDVIKVKDKVTRCFWKLAVVELIEGKDGHIQVAIVKDGELNSSRKGVTLKRSDMHLYLIEGKADNTKPESDEMLEDQSKLLLETISYIAELYRSVRNMLGYSDAGSGGLKIISCLFIQLRNSMWHFISSILKIV